MTSAGKVPTSDNTLLSPFEASVEARAYLQQKAFLIHHAWLGMPEVSFNDSEPHFAQLQSDRSEIIDTNQLGIADIARLNILLWKRLSIRHRYQASDFIPAELWGPQHMTRRGAPTCCYNTTDQVCTYSLATYLSRLPHAAAAEVQDLGFSLSPTGRTFSCKILALVGLSPNGTY